MPKRTPRNTLRKSSDKVFQILRITGAGNKYVTSRKAKSEEDAIKAHIEDWEITDPHQIKRLVARAEQ